MPFVDLISKDDFASIFYRTSTLCDNVGGFDSAKPTIIILHPMFLDSTWLDSQFGDPRLYTQYNLIAFDMRTDGKSMCQLSGKHDSWVDAADIAFCHQKLYLPPCHVFALEPTAVNCALRFALLFPEMCSSLALCNIPAPVEQRWSSTALEELIHSWCFSEDLEGLEHAASEILSYFLGANSDCDVQDELVEFWETTMAPKKRPWIIESLSVLLNRTPLNPESCAVITQPVLIFHGDRNEICPRNYSETLASQLMNAKGGPVIFPVKGAATYLSIFPGSASIVNQTLTKFLSRSPPTRSDLLPPEIPLRDRMKVALHRQAGLVGRKDVDSLDPLSPLSFSCLDEQVIKKQADLISRYAKNRTSAFNPLGADAKPIRKLSAGKRDHWFESGKDGLSVAVPQTVGAILPPERPKQEPDHTTPRMDRETQIVKTVSTTTTVEKYVMKTPTVKAVLLRETPSAPLGRIPVAP